ncbi:hypothetical protein [Enterobacter hormaechei]|uniref:hypothetical protein n=1 Tax=Enterobacter hormaechei TaxID=158836 RepID=UPI000CD012D9|nr:hypothetical protein [Enterobacter hormaechei]PNY62856.1 hypothetical protein C2M14_08780 [Enterobacter cloacae]HDT3785425.1 hypothetical protein [Enterobacter hormaechei subsp. steigerwaltii]MBG0648545.1 hypothetical protein [Enterobacter hormaechei]MCO7992378.1 hypothetical protein [Enterobacter hormaechei]MCO8002051.1 hypothetical protein [Enterobacter hormaechei]
MSSSAFFLQSSLDSLPKSSFSFLWADHIEFKCLISQDKMYTIGQFKDPTDEEVNLASNNEDDLCYDNDSIIDIPPDLDLLKPDEKLERRWVDIKNKLEIRKKHYKNLWPFTFHDDILKLNYDDCNINHKIYIFLLMSSQLKRFQKTKYSLLTNPFETLSAYLFKCLMPKGWNVKMTGAKASSGKIYPKLKRLADELRATMVIDKDDFDEYNNGDARLDLVAWHPMGDERGFIPIAFAQCGCSPTDWEHKQLEAHPISMRNTFSTQSPALSYYFMPHDLLKGLSKWERRDKILEVILIDRFRIMQLIKTYEEELKCIVDKKELARLYIVKKALNYQQDYFA